MISPAVAAAQLERVASMPGYPRDNDAAQQDLLDALRRASSSDEHCKEIIDGWVESSRFAPAVADIYDIGTRTRHEPKNNCAICDGTGWISTKRYNEKLDMEISMSDRCPACSKPERTVQQIDRVQRLKELDCKFAAESGDLIKRLAAVKQIGGR